MRHGVARSNLRRPVFLLDRRRSIPHPRHSGRAGARSGTQGPPPRRLPLGSGLNAPHCPGMTMARIVGYWPVAAIALTARRRTLFTPGSRADSADKHSDHATIALARPPGRRVLTDIRSGCGDGRLGWQMERSQFPSVSAGLLIAVASDGRARVGGPSRSFTTSPLLPRAASFAISDRAGERNRTSAGARNHVRPVLARQSQAVWPMTKYGEMQTVATAPSRLNGRLSTKAAWVR
jgi:hypothetical protein